VKPPSDTLLRYVPYSFKKIQSTVMKMVEGGRFFFEDAYQNLKKNPFFEMQLTGVTLRGE
jgi:hypothetical protein